MKNALSIARKLSPIGHKVYVVGSYNVHALLHRNFGSDIDLTTAARPEEIKKVLRVVGEIGAKYGTLIAREGGGSYEITTFRRDIGSVNRRRPEQVVFTDSLEEDAARRDFTFNAIYFDPLTGEYTDPTGGIKDLKAGVIRFVGDANQRINEDALRILRYIRLKNKYGLYPANEQDEEIIKERITDLADISPERIKQELDKMLLDKTNLSALEDLKRLGFFKHFMPNIDALSHAPGGKKMHLEGDAWIHTKMAIKELNHLKCHDIDLYWATLLHDIGKYSTYEYDPNGNIHYYHHEEIGAKIFNESIRTYLLFSKESIKKITWLLKNHIRIGSIQKMKKPKKYRFMMHLYFPDLITLAKVDNLGKKPSEAFGPELLKMYEEFQTKLKNVRFVTGDDILRKYPDLKGAEIGKRIKAENDEILSKL